MAALVDLAGVRYSYPDAAQRALDGVSLVLDGGLCAVAGPSGGGKSTLLRLFNGLVPHLYGGRIAGRVTVDGVDVLRSTTRRLATSVGFVFQDVERQAVHTTVERDIAFGLENLGCDPAEMRRRVHAITERLAIAHLLDRTISSLSGGERQRVAVAGALVLRPSLLVLDEPFSQLDGSGASALLRLCTELRDSGTAVIISEHRLDELLPAADSMVTVVAGRVAGPADPRAVAGTLDSAPQVVRLSRRLRWTPPLLDAAALVIPRLAGAPTAVSRPGASTAHRAWELDGITAGPGSLLRGVCVGGDRGEVIAVLGENGSGKTTLLRVIAGLLDPVRGRVWRDSGRVAYLPQNPGALLHRETVAAEIAWTGRRQPRGPQDQVDPREITALLGVDAFAASDPRDLSSGQRQRAALAAILAGSPRLVLLDEPTRGMDGAARDGLIAAARRLATQGSSVVVATHDTDLAACLADRVLIVDDGVVHDRGHPTHALSGEQQFATQLGRRATSPGPVTVDAVAELFTAAPKQRALTR